MTSVRMSYKEAVFEYRSQPTRSLGLVKFVLNFNSTLKCTSFMYNT
jgi:hypothetical protein